MAEAKKETDMLADIDDCVLGLGSYFGFWGLCFRLQGFETMCLKGGSVINVHDLSLYFMVFHLGAQISANQDLSHISNPNLAWPDTHFSSITTAVNACDLYVAMYCSWNDLNSLEVVG